MADLRVPHLELPFFAADRRESPPDEGMDDVQRYPAILSRSWRMTGNPDLIGSSVGLVPRNALAFTNDRVNSRVVGHSEVIVQVLINAVTGNVERSTDFYD